MTEKSFQIDGMSCEHCVKAIEKEFALLDIDYYEVEIGIANVKYDITRVEEESIIRAIHDAGYSLKPKE